MALETSTYINGLVATNPVDSTDQVASLGGHVRLLKAAIKATFPNVSGAVNPTQQEMNYLVGVTSSIQTQLAAKAVPADIIAAVAAHAAASNPHTEYAAALEAHVAAADPHPVYLTAAELAASALLGVGQTWQDVRASRVEGTSYQNTSGKPIQVSVIMQGDGGQNQLLVGASSPANLVVDYEISAGTAGASRHALQAIIPPDYWYMVDSVSDAFVLSWLELR